MFSKLMLKSKLTTAILTLSVLIMFAPGVTTAQESDGWNFRITPYLWMLGLDGTTAALGSDVPIKADFGDILDLLNLALMANMEFNNGTWFVVLDTQWSDLEAPIETGGPFGGKIEIELIIIDGLVGVAVHENIDIYIGARYYDQDITVIPNMLPSVGLGDDWTDILVGFRVNNDFADKWSFAGRVDAAIGGDSDSAWLLQAMLLRHFGDNKHLDLGWRYYDVDYESGSGLTRFKWDVAHSGPVVGFSWEF